MTRAAPDRCSRTAERYATGIRNAVGIALDPTGHGIYVSQHGRDQLRNNWPALYTPEEEATLPAEEVLRLQPGGDYGWPECYFDAGPAQARAGAGIRRRWRQDGRRVRGEDCRRSRTTRRIGRPTICWCIASDQFPARYRDGIFIAFHGSWDRAPYAQGGYNVVFQPLIDGKATGSCEIFADGFAG